MPQVDFDESKHVHALIPNRSRQPAVVTKVTQGIGQQSGKRNLKVEFQIYDGDFKGRVLSDYVSPFPEAADFSRVKFGNLCRACGIQGQLGDTDRLLNVPIVIEIKHEVYQGEPSEKVGGYYSAGSVASGGAPRPHGGRAPVDEYAVNTDPLTAAEKAAIEASEQTEYATDLPATPEPTHDNHPLRRPVEGEPGYVPF